MQDVAQLPAVQIVRNAGPGALAGGQGAAEEALWAQVVEEPRQARVVAGHGFDRSHEVGAFSGGDELEPLAAQQVEGPELFDGGIGPHAPQRPGAAGVAAGAGDIGRRSEERSVGKEWFRTCRYRWSPEQ